MVDSTFARRKPAALIIAALFAFAGIGASAGLVTATPAQALITNNSVKTLSTRATTYVDKNSPKTSFAGAKVLKVSSSRYFSYISFQKIALAANQKIVAATLSVKAVGGTTSTGLVAQPVKAGWSGAKLTYNTRPSVGADLNSPVKATVGKISTIKLSSASFSYISGIGLAVKMKHSKANTTVNLGKLASESKLAVTIATTVPVPTNLVTQREVFAHYHPQFPISLNDVYTPADQDYYTTQYLATGGENGKHASYGGFLRDRPLPEVKRAAGVDRIAENFKQEIADAKAAGVNGFAVDQWSFGEDQYTARLKGLAAAAKDVGGFKIMFQPDVSPDDAATPTQVASSLVSIANTYGISTKGGPIYADNTGRIVVSPFQAEDKGPTYWSNVLSEMNRLGAPAVLWPLFVDPTQAKANQAAWNAISIGFADWGGREAMNGTADGTWSNADWATANSKMWMQPVSVQDARYYTWKDRSGTHSNMYQEAANSEVLRNNWSWAMGKAGKPAANLVMLVTWNDYSESTSFAPSVGNKYSILDLNKYYLKQYKAAAAAVDTSTEAVFVSHRLHKSSFVPSYTYPSVPRTNGNGKAPQNTVEVVSFLKSEAQVQVNLGSSGVQTYTAGAGVTTKSFPLPASGVIKVQYLRSGQILGTATTTSSVTATPAKQDMSYLFASSLR